MRVIIDYILKNKEWIFSGVGVLIISGLFLIIRNTVRWFPSRSYFVKQNLKAFNIGIILLMARNNRLKTLLPLMPQAREVLENIKAGDFIRVGGS